MIDQLRLGSRLRRTVERGLTRVPEFAETAQRWEAWWRQEADGPLLVGTAPVPGASTRPKPFGAIEEPERWVRESLQRLEETWFLDASIPHIRVDFGPVLTAAFLGADLHFALRENTSWQTPVDAVYDQDLTLDPGNRWYRACMRLTKRLAEDAAGNYLISLPDLSGATDILANLRGSEQLLMDLYDRPDDVLRVLPALVDAWEMAYDALLTTITDAGAGVTSWLHAWSRIPYTVPTCDFNAMIGHDHFQTFCLPFLEEQGRRAGRCLFHLDGPDAARHAQVIAGSSIHAVQYTPGAGSTGAIPRIPMLQMIQEAGKPVLVIAEAWEVPQLMSALDPGGTAIFVDGLKDPHEGLELMSLLPRA